MSDFAPGAAIWRTRRNIRVVSDSGPFTLSCETWRQSQKRNYITYRTEVGEDRATATGNMYKKIDRIWTGRVIFDIRKRRDRETTQIPSVFAPPPVRSKPFWISSRSFASETRIPGVLCGVVCVMLSLAILVQYRLVTDGRTNRRTDGHIYTQR